MQQPLVSVIIPTHNRLKFLQEAVKSIKAQTLKDWELIIVDDASSDQTWDWLTQLQNPQIKVFRQNTNSLRANACNRVLQEARGEFIMFLDDDDYLRPDALENMTKPLIGNTQIVGTVGARYKFKEGVYAIRINHPQNSFKRIIWPELLFGWSAIPSQSLYRTQIVQQVGGWRVEFNPADDRDLWLRVSQYGWVAIIPAIVVEYRAHEGQSRPKNIVEIREHVFQTFINTLSPEQQVKGKRIRESANYAQKGEDQYRKGNYQVALSSYFQACQAAPELVISPLVGLSLVRGLAKSLVKSLLPK